MIIYFAGTESSTFLEKKYAIPAATAVASNAPNAVTGSKNTLGRVPGKFYFCISVNCYIKIV